MKKALFISGLLISAFLFSPKVYAQEYVLNNATSTHSAPLNAGITNASQTVTFPLSSLHPSFTINSVSIYIDAVTTAGNLQAYLSTPSTVPHQHLRSSNVVNVSTTGWKKFTFASPLTIDNTTLASNTPAFLEFDALTFTGTAGVSNVPTYGSPYYGTFDNDRQGNFSENYPWGMFVSGVFGLQTPTGGQLLFAINLDNPDSVLTIDHPQQNSTVSTLPVLIDGGCENAVELLIYNGITYASSTSAFGSTRTCSANRYSYTINLFENGFWNVHASSTDASESVVFYFLAQTQGPLPFATSSNPFASTTNPFNALSCDIDSAFNIFCDYFQRFSSGRPFSYFPQIASALWDAMSNATATPWTTGVEFDNGNGTTTIGAIDSTTFDPVPDSFKSNMRTLSGIGMVLGVVFLIWSLRHKLL